MIEPTGNNDSAEFGAKMTFRGQFAGIWVFVLKIRSHDTFFRAEKMCILKK
jgi:hypothetical protein